MRTLRKLIFTAIGLVLAFVIGFFSSIIAFIGVGYIAFTKVSIDKLEEVGVVDIESHAEGLACTHKILLQRHCKQVICLSWVFSGGTLSCHEGLRRDTVISHIVTPVKAASDFILSSAGSMNVKRHIGRAVLVIKVSINEL